MEQTAEEQYLQNTAKLLIWLSREANQPLLPSDTRNVQKQARTLYAEDVGQTKLLCDLIGIIGRREVFELIKNNVQLRRARELANWIEEHDEADRRREESEKREAKEQEKDVIMRLLDDLPQDSLEKLRMILQQAK
jgi:hypothetical protein